MHATVKAARWALAFSFLAIPAVSNAQAWTPRAGYGSVSMGMQYTRVMKHLFSTNTEGYVDPTGYVGGPKNAMYIGDVVGQTVFLAADYGLMERLAVSAQTAYIASRYRGLAPEGPDDDGKFHGGLQDFYAGVRYRLPVPEVALTPALSLRTPLGKYTDFGHAALGHGHTEVGVGATAGRTLSPLLPQVAVQAGYTHMFVEDIHEFSVDRDVFDASLAFFATNSITLSGSFRYSRVKDGLDWWNDITTEEAFHLHDAAAKALSRHGTANASFRLGRSYTLSAGYEWTFSGINTHAVNAGTLIVSREISTRRR